MKHCEMKIVNRLGLNEHGCYPFSDSSINNIPNINMFIENNINEKIHEACMEVLRKSLSIHNKYRYGEMGILLSTYDGSIYKVFKGKYLSIDLGNQGFNEIVENRNMDDLILVHNHPNNSNFSAADIAVLINTKSLYGLVVVGNTHNVYIVTKEVQSLANDLIDYIEIESNKLAKLDGNKYDIKEYKDYVVSEVLTTDSKKFGLDFIKLRRTSK